MIYWTRKELIIGELWSKRFDKNGKKIYDGDEVKLSDGTILTVVFEEGAFWVKMDGHRVLLKDAEVELN